MNQSQLVKAARSGDHDAFQKLVRNLEPRVAATVVGMLGSCQEADDVGQETFIRLYRSLNDFRGDASIETYVTRIAINLSLNELKRRKRVFAIFNLDECPSEQPVYDGREDVARQEIRVMVQTALKKLSPRYRSVIVLRLIDGYSTRETAEILALPEGTVLSRLARAQKKMRELLNPMLGVKT
ncbi:MAG: RNA polymerase sigma factor [Candidatus Neomarinimicrobiota bacterium]